MSESNRIVILHQKQHTTRKRRSCSVSITGNPSCQTRESLIFAMLKSLTLLLFVFVGSWVMSTESRKLTKIEMIYVFAISINWWLFTVRENENRDFRFTFSFSFDYRTGLNPIRCGLGPFKITTPYSVWEIIRALRKKRV